MLLSVNCDIITLDLHTAVAPDVVGDVIQLPFTTEAFDAVLCCQVLEHLPADALTRGLLELSRVARARLILSLPRALKSVSVVLRTNARSLLRVTLPTWLRTPAKRLGREHYWELGVGGPTQRSVHLQLQELFVECRSFVLPENPYHHFWICDK
jgi:hypothetical protein